MSDTKIELSRAELQALYVAASYCSAHAQRVNTARAEEGDEPVDRYQFTALSKRLDDLRGLTTTERIDAFAVVQRYIRQHGRKVCNDPERYQLMNKDFNLICGSAGNRYHITVGGCKIITWDADELEITFSSHAASVDLKNIAQKISELSK